MLNFLIPLIALILTNPITAYDYNPDDKLNQLAMTMAILKQSYISDMDNDVIAEKAIRGLLNELDPHSGYLDMNELDALEDTTNGKVTGIGVEVTMENGLLKIIAPLENSPADLAGLKNGDYITHVDGSLVLEIGIAEAVTRIKGKSGTKVKITVARPGVKKPLHFHIKRKAVSAPSVKAEMITDTIGYVKIGYFGLPTKDETEKAVKRLMRENSNITGMVIDLRNNPGGVLSSAVEITDLFLDNRKIGYDKVITVAKERNMSVTQSYESKSLDITDDLPLAVVINSGSASASEIMAAALKDHKRAIIVGETSFGKGSIQSVMPLSNETAIKITTGLYYSPAGNVVQKKGVSPNVYAESLQPSDKNLLDFRESEYLNSITSSSSKLEDSTSNVQMKIVHKFGFEVYQAMQTLLQNQRQPKCQ